MWELFGFFWRRRSEKNRVWKIGFHTCAHEARSLSSHLLILNKRQSAVFLSECQVKTLFSRGVFLFGALTHPVGFLSIAAVYFFFFFWNSHLCHILCSKWASTASGNCQFYVVYKISSYWTLSCGSTSVASSKIWIQLQNFSQGHKVLDGLGSIIFRGAAKLEPSGRLPPPVRAFSKFPVPPVRVTEPKAVDQSSSFHHSH